MYKYYISEILFFSVFLFLIISTIIRQAKIKRKLIAKSMKELDSRIFVSIVFLIMAALKLYNAIKYFNSMLKYNYISEYRHSLISFIIYLLCFLFYIILALRRKVICEDGIYTNDGNYKWAKIRTYEWIDLNTTTSRDNVKYISLYFLCVNSNRIKFFDVTTSDIRFKIASYDKEKVAIFLSKVLPNKEK